MKKRNILYKLFILPVEKVPIFYFTIKGRWMAMAKELAMKNETLCLLIAEGRTELLGMLWEQSKNLAFFFLRKLTTKQGGQIAMDTGGIAEDDLQTIAFLAVSRVSTSYQSGKVYSYSKALEYAVKTEFYEATGQRTQRAKEEPLRGALSLDKQSTGEHGSETFLALLVDKDSEKPFEDVVNHMETNALRKLLDQAMEEILTEREKYVLNEHYYKGKPFSSIADTLHVSPTAIGHNRNHAFKKLRQCYALRTWYGYDKQRDLYFNSLHYWRSQQASIPEIAFERAQYFEKLLKSGN